VLISVCARCQQPKFAFQAARSIGPGEGNLDRAIVVLKLNGSNRWGSGLQNSWKQSLARTANVWMPTPSFLFPFTGRGCGSAVFKQIEPV
jgi:hypothetical protein